MSPVGSSKSRLVVEENVRHRGAAKVIGFLSNRKPNTGAMQSVLGKRLEEGGYAVRFYEKESAALAAGSELLDRIARECRRAINGTGD
ncbi:hypothetical protein EPN42_05400 [bacterium]|nr:MAG: hypothetical protein EPN42_05400 [bacterium]